MPYQSRAEQNNNLKYARRLFLLVKLTIFIIAYMHADNIRLSLETSGYSPLRTHPAVIYYIPIHSYTGCPPAIPSNSR